MRGKGRAGLACVLVLSLLLVSCGGEKKQVEFEPGETVDTYWFSFSVDSVQALDSWQGRQADAGYRLAVCGLTIESTFSSSVPMGRSDFVLLWETGEKAEGESSSEAPWAGMEGVYPLPQYDGGQLPDEYTLEPDETVEGLLVYQVPDTVTRAALMFEEYYADGSEDDYTVGDHYLVWLDLGGDARGEADLS